jgi:hypothetical protein
MSKVYETLTVLGRDFHFEWECPGQWNGLNAWQLRRIINLQQMGLTPLQFLAFAVPVLLEVPKSLIKQFVLGRRINDEYLELSSFLLDKDQHLSKNVFATNRGFKAASKWQELYGKNFFAAEIYLNEYMKAKDPLMLDHFVASLYTTKDELHLVNPERDYHKFAKWPMEVKLAIVTFYTGCRIEFHATYPRVFKKGKGGSTGYGKGLLNLRSQLAKNDLAKTNGIDATPLPEMLFQLTKDIEDAQDKSQ